MSLALELWRVLEAWDAAKHPRGPGGRFIKLGGGGHHDKPSLADVIRGTAVEGPKRQRKDKGGMSVADAVRQAARRSDKTGRPTQRSVDEHRAHGAHDVADEVDRALAEAGVSEEVRAAVSGRARARAETHGPRPETLPRQAKAEPKGPASTAEVQGDIHDAVRSINAGGPAGDWVGLADLREKLGDRHSRADVDKALEGMIDTEGVRIIPVANTKALKPRDREAALSIGGEDNHAISIRGDVARPGAKAVALDQPQSTRPRAGVLSTDVTTSGADIANRYGKTAAAIAAKRAAAPAAAAGPAQKPARARREFSAADAATVGAKLETAKSRDEAQAHLADLTAPQLRQVAGLMGVSLRSGDTKPRMANTIVEGTAGRRLDSKAIGKLGSAPAAKVEEPALPARTTTPAASPFAGTQDWWAPPPSASKPRVPAVAAPRAKASSSRGRAGHGNDQLGAITDDLVKDDGAGGTAYDQAEAAYGEGDPRDGVLTELTRAQGFGLPRTGSVDDEVRGGGVELWRGVRPQGEFSWRGEQTTGGTKSAARQVAEMRDDPGFEYGSGLYGNGIYFSVDKAVAGTFATPDAEGGNNDGKGVVVRVAIRPDAKVVDWKDLQQEREAWFEQSRSDSSPGARRARELFADDGRFAAARGYDAIRVEGKQDGHVTSDGGESAATQYVLLNRGALTMEAS